MTKVILHGFDEHWNEVSETLELQGPRPVESAHRYTWAERPLMRFTGENFGTISVSRRPLRPKPYRRGLTKSQKKSRP